MEQQQLRGEIKLPFHYIFENLVVFEHLKTVGECKTFSLILKGEKSSLKNSSVIFVTSTFYDQIYMILWLRKIDGKAKESFLVEKKKKKYFANILTITFSIPLNIEIF